MCSPVQNSKYLHNLPTVLKILKSSFVLNHTYPGDHHSHYIMLNLPCNFYQFLDQSLSKFSKVPMLLTLLWNYDSLIPKEDRVIKISRILDNPCFYSVKKIISIFLFIWCQQQSSTIQRFTVIQFVILHYFFWLKLIRLWYVLVPNSSVLFFKIILNNEYM